MKDKAFGKSCHRMTKCTKSPITLMVNDTIQISVKCLYDLPFHDLCNIIDAMPVQIVRHNTVITLIKLIPRYKMLDALLSVTDAVMMLLRKDKSYYFSFKFNQKSCIHKKIYFLGPLKKR